MSSQERILGYYPLACGHRGEVIYRKRGVKGGIGVCGTVDHCSVCSKVKEIRFENGKSGKEYNPIVYLIRDYDPTLIQKAKS